MDPTAIDSLPGDETEPDSKNGDMDIGRPSWKLRRIVVFSTIGFCWGAIIYLLGWAPDDGLRQTLAMGLVALAGSVVTSYVFGAAWDDKNVMQAQTQVNRYRTILNINSPRQSTPSVVPEDFKG